MKLKSILCGVLSLAVFAGCKEEAPQPMFNVSRPVAEISADGGVLPVEVTSNVEWSAEADAEWITAITPSSGAASGNKPVAVEVTVAANETTEERTAAVTFEAAGLVKTMSITQMGKAAENPPVDGPGQGQDSDMFVAWAFSTDMKGLNEATWHQDKNDLAAGGGDKYLGATLGSGRIQYIQPDKSGFETDKVRRHTGKNGEPMFYGSWVGDYYLFEADCNLTANSNVSISFGIWGKANAMKLWKLEYNDGGQWKDALEIQTLGDVEYNVACGTESNPTLVNAAVVFASATDKVSFRLTCVSKISISDAELEKPKNDQYVRIDPNYPVIIKGSAITDEDRSGVVSPSLAISSTKMTAGASESTVSLTVTSNLDWSAKAKDPFLTPIPASGTASSAPVEASVVVAANSEAEREGSVSFEAVYGNVTIVKTLTVTQQSGVVDPEPDPDPTPGPDTGYSLLAKWDLLTAVDNFAESEGAHKDAGDHGKYVNATTGTGCLSYVQVDKNALSGSKMYRKFGNADLMAYGAWEGDYFLFTAENGSDIPAGTEMSISFYIRGSNASAMRDWALEYWDEGQWKTAISAFTMTNKVQEVAAKVTMTNAGKVAQFRLRCVSRMLIGGSEATAAPEVANRISKDYPIIIKSGAITDADK